MDHIYLEGLELDCIVGLRPPERRRRQRVILDLRLDLDLRQAAESGRIAHTADYAKVADEVCLLLRFRAYRLIEMATSELSSMLLGVHPMLKSVQVRLEKPAALRGRARSASVSISREQTDKPICSHPFGSQTVLSENREAGLYLFEVKPGSTLPPISNTRRRCLEWVVSGTSEADKSEGLFVFPQGRYSGFCNRSEQLVTLFCCACPGLQPQPDWLHEGHFGRALH